MEDGNKNTSIIQKKVLIVDDEPGLVSYLDSLLTDNGFKTIKAFDGKDGMSKTLSGKPDLITLDISMPEESGIKMFSELQENPATSQIPVVIVTGLSTDFKRFMTFLERKDRLAPPAAYFEKPIDKDEFVAKIKKILK
jgi:DNA-binding response OmpR family regulator